ncbi:MAG: FAD-dependent thymidylate synthase [Ruminococcaceae bacterium]|nr:FAD-dependent thymidylate synthase [Oscillospiraceae bacterium]
MKVELLAYTPNADKLVAAAAKLCYAQSDIDSLLDNLTPEKTEAFLDKLMALGHESPVEHASFTFGIEGVSRTLLAQLTRHRLASFSVQSQRYVSKSGFSYIVPPEIENCPQARELYLAAMRRNAEDYDAIRNLLIDKHKSAYMAEGKDEKQALALAEKKANEDARFVLPGACDTRIIMTMNTRSLYNFFKLRCCNRAQWEICEMAWQMLALVREVSPLLFRNAGPACVRKGCSEGAMSCGKALEVRARHQALNN